LAVKNYRLALSDEKHLATTFSVPSKFRKYRGSLQCLVMAKG